MPAIAVPSSFLSISINTHHYNYHFKLSNLFILYHYTSGNNKDLEESTEIFYDTSAKPTSPWSFPRILCYYKVDVSRPSSLSKEFDDVGNYITFYGVVTW